MIKLQICDYLETLEEEVRECVYSCFSEALPPVYLFGFTGRPNMGGQVV